MATYNWRRLSCPHQLCAIDSRYLDQLLAPHGEFLLAHGVSLPLEDREAPLTYINLLQLLLSPPADTPCELLNAVYFIDSLATPLGMEALEAAAKEAGINIPQHLPLTPREIVLQLWLKNPLLVERVHDKLAIRRLRVFDYFQAESAELPWLAELPGTVLQAMESELNECFHAHRRGRYARIFLSEMNGNLWLYIGHGGLLRREGIVEKHGPSSICYRPEIFDAVVFIRSTGELGIHAHSHWQTALYQRIFGKYFFNDEKFFAGAAKYTLAPLAEYGSDALQCLDVPGMQWVKMTNITLREPGKVPRLEKPKSVDLFGSWESKWLPFSPRSRLISATFDIKFFGCPVPRSVTIRPSNRAYYPSDIDQSWIEQWLTRRGFIRSKGEAENDVVETVLAVA